MGRREGNNPKWTYVEWMKNTLSSILREKNSTAICSPLINTIKAPILSSNGVSVNGSFGNSVEGGSYRYVLRNRFIVVIDCKYAFLSSQKLSRVIFHPALTLSGSNRISSEFSSHSH